MRPSQLGIADMYICESQSPFYMIIFSIIYEMMDKQSEKQQQNTTKINPCA